jgi:hypothetical protein
LDEFRRNVSSTGLIAAKPCDAATVAPPFCGGRGLHGLEKEKAILSDRL